MYGLHNKRTSEYIIGNCKGKEIVKAEEEGGARKARERERDAGQVANATTGQSCAWKGKNNVPTSPLQVPLQSHASLLVNKCHCVEWCLLSAKCACLGLDQMFILMFCALLVSSLPHKSVDHQEF